MQKIGGMILFVDSFTKIYFYYENKQIALL